MKTAKKRLILLLFLYFELMVKDDKTAHSGGLNCMLLGLVLLVYFIYAK